MRMSGKTILITGGATGIGFAIAERLARENKVIICGRRQERLDAAVKRLPGIRAIRCDVSNEAERKALCDRVVSEFGGLDVLVNNAGIQRRVDFRKGVEDLTADEDEIEINLGSQIYMSALFIPILMKREAAAIVNVSSGLGLVPLAVFPVYCATKAAIHSFSMSLRHQLKGTPIKVFEVIPPTVHDTELKGKPIPKTDYSVSAGEVADAVAKGLEDNRTEIAIGPSAGWLRASRAELDLAFQGING